MAPRRGGLLAQGHGEIPTMAISAPVTGAKALDILDLKICEPS